MTDTQPEAIEFIPFTARLRSDLHDGLRTRADELDWSMNSALNEAVQVFLDRSAEVDTVAWMKNGWTVMEERGSSGHGYHIELFVSLPYMEDCDQRAYELQDRVSRLTTEFGGHDVQTRIMALGGMEMRRPATALPTPTG